MIDVLEYISQALHDFIDESNKGKNLFLLLIEAIQAFQYADDSNGNIGLLVSGTINIIL